MKLFHKGLTKTCSACKLNKPICDFYSNRAKSTGMESKCKVCFKSKIKKYYSKDYVPCITEKQLSVERWANVEIDNICLPYKISDCGRVINLVTGKIMKPSLDQRGYPQNTLTNKGNKKTRRVHVLVAMAFIENIEKLPEVNHKDGNKFNPHYSNLEWNTSKQNKRHSMENGLWLPHKLNPRTKRVINNGTGQIYLSLKDAAENISVDYKYLSLMLLGKATNKTNLSYL